jgi:hypothetical protein
LKVENIFRKFGIKIGVLKVQFEEVLNDQTVILCVYYVYKLFHWVIFLPLLRLFKCRASLGARFVTSVTKRKHFNRRRFFPDILKLSHVYKNITIICFRICIHKEQIWEHLFAGMDKLDKWFFLIVRSLHALTITTRLSLRYVWELTFREICKFGPPPPSNGYIF